jgi:ADP-ribose pyrophosphatase
MKKLIPTSSILIPSSAKKVFEGVLFSAYQWDQTMYDGSCQIYEMLKRQDTVAAICIVDNKIIVLNDEQPHSGHHLSFPGGRVEPSDPTIQDAVKREVLEETGYSFRNWKLIKVDQPSIELEWFTYLYVVWDVIEKIAATPDAGEKITLNLMEFNLVKQMALSRGGHISHHGDIFEVLTSLDQVQSIPDYHGQAVDR